MKEDNRSSRRLIAEQTGIPKTDVQQILGEDLQKRKLCARFVQYALTAELKEQRLNHTYDLIETIKPAAVQNILILKINDKDNADFVF